MGNVEFLIILLLGWMAAILFLFSATFCLRYAYQNNWIGPVGRVAIGELAGAGLVIAGCRYLLNGWPFFAAIEVPSADESINSVTTPQLVDFFATPDVFEHARQDLSDLRIYTVDGNTVPYALRILSPFGRDLRKCRCERLEASGLRACHSIYVWRTGFD